MTFLSYHFPGQGLNAVHSIDLGREMITLALGNSHCERRETAMTFGQLTGESNASVNSGLQDCTGQHYKGYEEMSWPVLILDPLFFLSYSQITVHTHA